MKVVVVALVAGVIILSCGLAEAPARPVFDASRNEGTSCFDHGIGQ